MLKNHKFFLFFVFVPLLLYCLSFANLFSSLKIVTEDANSTVSTFVHYKYSIFDRLIEDNPKIIIIVMGLYFITIGYDISFAFVEVQNGIVYAIIFNSFSICLFLYTYLYTYLQYCV